VKMVQLLCEAQGSDVNVTDRLGRSVLGYYVGAEPLDRIVPSTQASYILEYLIGRGADMYAKSKAGMSLVDYAVCRVNGDEPLRFLLQHDLKLIDKETDKWTSLHWACRQGNSQTAKILLEHGSRMKKVTTLQPLQSWTPYEILIHYRAVPREFDESTTYALGRPDKIEVSPDMSSREQIEYASLEATDIRRRTQCSLCAMRVFVCIIGLPFPQSFDVDQC
jgi:ankyrin repeat protein